MDFRKLRHIVTVADERSFTRAAARLGISQPGLSRSIADIEEGCGERLFDRTAGGVVPTAFGVPVIESARRVLAELAHFDRDLAARAGAQIGRVAFGGGPLVAALAFAPTLAKLVELRPGLEVETLIAPGRDLAEALLSGRIEFAILSEQVLADTEGFAVEKLAELPLVLLVRAGHPLAGRTELDERELAAYPLATGSVQGIDLKDSSLPPHNGVFVCDDFHVLRDLVLASDACWLASSALAKSSEGIVALDVRLKTGPTFAQIVSIRIEGREPSPAARVALEQVRQVFAGI